LISQVSEQVRLENNSPTRKIISPIIYIKDEDDEEDSVSILEARMKSLQNDLAKEPAHIKSNNTHNEVKDSPLGAPPKAPSLTDLFTGKVHGSDLKAEGDVLFCCICVEDATVFCPDCDDPYCVSHSNVFCSK
jgi:hypothetical protein